MNLILSLILGILLVVNLHSQTHIRIMETIPTVRVELPESPFYEKTWFNTLIAGLIGLGGALLAFKLAANRDDRLREKENLEQQRKAELQESNRLVRELSAIKARADGKVHGLIISAQNLNWYWVRTKFMISTSEGNEEWLTKHFLEMEKYNLLVSEFISIVSEFGGLSNTDKEFAPLVISLREYKFEHTPDSTGLLKKTEVPTIINAYLKTTFQDEIVVRMVDLMEAQINRLRVVPAATELPYQML